MQVKYSFWIVLGKIFRSCALLLLICSFVGFFVTGAWGAIPAAERTVLLNLYTSTNGPGWTNSTGWNELVNTECGWYGVQCDPDQIHVISINLTGNNLASTLPDLSDLTNLVSFSVNDNKLTGTMTTLNGLSILENFDVSGNQLTGSIPPLGGLTNLQGFLAFNVTDGAV